MHGELTADDRNLLRTVAKQLNNRCKLSCLTVKKEEEDDKKGENAKQATVYPNKKVSFCEIIYP